MSLVMVMAMGLSLGSTGCNRPPDLNWPTNLTYATNPAIYTRGTAIAPNVPSSGGGQVVSYAVAPALPAGLSLDSSTGVISGTPAEITAKASYAVTATSNAGGIATASLSVTVNPPAPAITVGPESQPVVVGMAGYFSVLASGTGPLDYQWLKNGVPISGATLTSYATPTAVEMDGAADFSVVVSDAYGGSTTSQATMSVSSGFTAIASLTTPRSSQTATLLPSGRVLIAGGYGSVAYLPSAELYDPAAVTPFTATGSMTTARSSHTATLLLNGKVLLAGGRGTLGVNVASAELYDPVAGTFLPAAGNLAAARYDHTATLLPNGKVLIAGGVGSSGAAVASWELYDPAAGFTATGSMTTARKAHTATLLPNGKVLIAGGDGGSGAAVASAELYDPAAGTFTATGSMTTARDAHTATLLPSGKVLIAGGVVTPGSVVASAELYDPVAGTFTATGSMTTARNAHTATLLPNVKVLIAGGTGPGGSLASAELYDPAAGTFMAAGSLAMPRHAHTATLLLGGTVLIAGGYGPSSSNTPIANAERYDPVAGTFTTTGNLARARASHTATQLPSGKVVIVGGYGPPALDSAEVYDPVSATFTTMGSLATARYLHTATLLPGGKVLIAGGLELEPSSPALASAELYDPASGTFTVTGSLAEARFAHTATLLPNGKVLVVGGGEGGPQENFLATAELYDPATGKFTSAAGKLTDDGRGYHTATLLPDGKVLIAAGFSLVGTPMKIAELYDPVAETFTRTGDLLAARRYHTATLLPSGQVLIAGGDQGSNYSYYLASAELYDPAAGKFTATGRLAVARCDHAATLLPNGKVLVSGGRNGAFPAGSLASAELYDPVAGTFSATGGLAATRGTHTATPLPSGRVLIAGGFGTSGYLESAELYRWW